MPRLRRLLTLLLALTMMPGWVTLAENVEHLLHDGHFAHTTHESGEAVHEDSDEHGCSPVSHVCPCHASQPVLLAEAPDLPPPTFVAAEQRDVAPDTTGRGPNRATSPPHRPPIG